MSEDCEVRARLGERFSLRKRTAFVLSSSTIARYLEEKLRMNDASSNEQFKPCVDLYLRPDIQELIRSNEEPSPSVLDEISSRLQVIHQGELLEELEQEARAYGSILHPIRKVPTEVLFNILGMVAMPRLGESLPETYLPRAMINTLEPMRTLLAITQVCSRWREIMLSSPQFWSYISLITTNTIDWEDLEIILLPSQSSSASQKDFLTHILLRQ
ncbi:F-box-like domain protein [Lentinula edodes]|uniref:F-box-like domain protein n=1 Tax=Lentinula edodes TaxID=5353 RepID=A0A1Q3EIQ5_LENED|nr:F-box-like domain protein [Lentinula edodes]